MSLFTSFINAENTCEETEKINIYFLFETHLKLFVRALFCACDADLSPAAVPADHVCVGHGGEECVCLQVLRQAG